MDVLEPKNLSDEKLVDLVRRKDKNLYKEVVKRYQDRLLRYANYLLNGIHEAEDVVQNALIKAYINLNSFDVKRKFSSWIYRIVHNEAVNLIKKKRREVSLDKNEFLSDSLTDDTNIELDFEKKELKKLIRRSLDRLPIKYREPMVLFFLEDKSYKEISDILRLPMGTVSIRLSRGKSTLKKIIGIKGEQIGQK
ncbi:MAG: sigma-70 family RNA polymerase sigma factor [Patescibacteria group bacterium]